MEKLGYKGGSTKTRRIPRAAGVAVKIEETPLLNSNRYETIQPRMTDTYDPTEELNTERSAEICSDTLRIRLVHQMKNVGRIRLLEDIEQRKIKANNIPQFFETSSILEKNIAFLWSAFLKRSDLLEGLLSIGAELNFCDQYGFSVLHLAAFSGCIPSTRFLISKQMEVNMQPKYYTPLHCAAFGNSVETAKMLLKNGALISIDTKTPSYEHSPLHCAIRANSLDCVKLFIEEGADVNSLKPSGANAIHLAADLGFAECLKALLNAPGADPNIGICTFVKNTTALHFATNSGNVECVILLLDKGADSNLENDCGFTALHAAVRKSYLECVKLLLEKGNAYVNHQDMYGFTALHLAALRDLPECVEMLISFGADITIKTKKGVTALNFITKFTPAVVAIITNKFDAAITLDRSQDIEKKDVELKLNFLELLRYSHPYEISYLKAFVDEGRNEILEHPLCSAFLYIKWGNIQRYYICSLMFYYLFVALLTNYVFLAVTPNCYNGSNDDNTTIEMEELCQKQAILVDLLQNNSFVMKMQNCYNGSKDENTTAQAQELCQKSNVFFFLLVCTTILEIFRKLCGTMGYSSIRQYFTHMENYLQWSVILSVFVLYDINAIQPYTFQYYTGFFAALLGCINLVVMLGQLPVFTVYVAMYTKVLKEVVKLFTVYSCMLVLFTVSFCVIFPSSSSFANPIVGFITVLLMMIGEIDLSLLTDNPDGKDSSVLLKIIGIITFVLFLFFVPITLMNLLVGIAVHDIQGLKKTAEQSKLVQQMKLIYYMESILFDDKQATWINKIRKHYLGSPQPCQDELYVNPFNLGEKKLPRDILMAAYEIAKKHEHSGYTNSPRYSEATNFSNNDKNNNNNSQESVHLSRATICTLTSKIYENAKHVEAITIEIKELKQLQQQASENINKLLLVISNQQRNNFAK